MDNKYDAILILGGGLTDEGELPLWSRRRFDEALRQYTGNEFLVPLSRWTTHKPPLLDEKNFPIDEAVVGANYLMQWGVPTEKILLENFSFDTIGNAYFSRTVHCEPRRLQRLCVITSQFHMPRVQELFNFVYSLSPTPFPFVLDYLAVSDEDLDSYQLKNRIQKEQEAITLMRSSMADVKTLAELHDFVFTKHRAYLAGPQRDFTPLKQDALY